MSERTNPTTMLAIDTSTRSIGLALYDGVQVLGERMWTSQDYHTVELAPAVSDLLSKAGIETGIGAKAEGSSRKKRCLGALAVALGPGSFTGLRIGLALAKGLALAGGLPMIGIPTLDALAAAQPYPGNISEFTADSGSEHRVGTGRQRSPDIRMSAILQAGRGRLAVGWYRFFNGVWQTDEPEGRVRIEVLTPHELSERIQSPTLVCGELTEEERHLLGRKRKNVILASPAFSQRRPSFLAELAWARWQAGQIDDPAMLSPIYLHYNEPIPDVAPDRR